jgi:hypothetical protein
MHVGQEQDRKVACGPSWMLHAVLSLFSRDQAGRLDPQTPRGMESVAVCCG